MKSRQFLKIVAALEIEHEAYPFAADIEAAEAAVAAARVKVATAADCPASMSPGEIIAMRDAGSRELEIAEIELRRLVAKSDEHRYSLGDKLLDLKTEVEPFLFACVEKAKANTRAALESVIGTDVSMWTGEIGSALHRICTLKAQPMFALARAVDGRNYGSVSAREKLRQIRAALEIAATIES